MYAVNFVYERNDSIALQVHALNVMEFLRYTIFSVNMNMITPATCIDCLSFLIFKLNNSIICKDSY